MNMVLAERGIQTENTRIVWVDTFKFIAMLYIYVGHMGDVSGGMFSYVWKFHVPMFFFASGLFANQGKPTKVKYFIWKQFLRLLVPYFFFTALSFGFGLISGGMPRGELAQNLLNSLLCVQQLYNEVLWFFPSLFFACILYHLMKKLLKKDIFVLLLSLGLHLIARQYLAQYTYVPLCANYSLIYLVFYSLAATFGRYLLKPKKATQKCLLLKQLTTAAISVVLLAYVVCFYLGKDLLLLVALPQIELLTTARALLLIGGNIVIAMLLSPVLALSRLGQHTLYMCGNELFIKTSVTVLLSSIGLSVQPSGALGCILYCMILLVIVHRVLVPLEKPLLDKLRP